MKIQELLEAGLIRRALDATPSGFSAGFQKGVGNAISSKGSSGGEKSQKGLKQLGLNLTDLRDGLKAALGKQELTSSQSKELQRLMDILTTGSY
jgi:hypothetical protein